MKWNIKFDFFPVVYLQWVLWPTRGRPSSLSVPSGIISEISSLLLHSCRRGLIKVDLKYDKSICWSASERICHLHHNRIIMGRWDTPALWGGCFAKMAHVKPHLYKWALDRSQGGGSKTPYITTRPLQHRAGKSAHVFSLFFKQIKGRWFMEGVTAEAGTACSAVPSLVYPRIPNHAHSSPTAADKIQTDSGKSHGGGRLRRDWNPTFQHFLLKFEV